MRKVVVFGLDILFISIIGHFSPHSAYANITAEQNPNPVYINSKSITITLRSTEDIFTIGKKYSIGFWYPAYNPNKDKPTDVYSDVKVLDQKTLTRTTAIGGFGLSPVVGKWHYKIWSGEKNDLNPNSIIYEGQFEMLPTPTPVGRIGLSLRMDSSVFEEGSIVPLHIININPDIFYTVWFVGSNNALFGGFFPKNSIVYDSEKNQNSTTIQINVGKASDKEICVAEGRLEKSFLAGDLLKNQRCSFPLKISVVVFRPTGIPTPIESNLSGIPEEQAEPSPTPTPTPLLPQHCARWAYSFPQGHPNSGSNDQPIPTNYPEYKDPNFTTRKCVAVDTAVGEVATDPFAFVKKLMSILLSLAGGIAVILIIVSGYKFMASQGNPEAVQAARDQLTSAIVGLLFIIFSLVILQVVGVDILKIPGFGK